MEKEPIDIEGYYTLWLFRDSFDNTWYAVVWDSSDVIQICGLCDPQGMGVYFESEAYHAPEWCEEHSIKYRKIEKTFLESI